MKNNIRTIAFYLPQFHPIPENDEWWGKGFTEWTNVGKAKPLFKDHYQPRVPADLGYYDLRIPETREKQAEMARKYGVEGFCYWHYWFGNGKQLLERPFQEVLSSGNPDFPFCLAWANESWKGPHHGIFNSKVLIEQKYPGPEDYQNHFYSILPALKDKRYITINEEPIILIYQPLFEDAKTLMNLWKSLARQNGLNGIHFIAHCKEISHIEPCKKIGYDSINLLRIGHYESNHQHFIDRVIRKVNKKTKGIARVYKYKDVIPYFSGKEDKFDYIFPSIIPNWDHTPRSGKAAYIFHESSPELFRKHIREVFDSVKNKSFQNRIVFIKSWNEWAEGNYLEPDQRFGLEYLEVLKQEIDSILS